MCYESLLGISDCYLSDIDIPVTGIYLDKLTGITSDELDQIIISPYTAGVQLFQDKRQSAWQLISADVVNKLKPSLKADTITEGQAIGYVQKGIDLIALGAGNYVGIEIELENPSAFVDMFISNMSVSIPGGTTPIDIYVFDAVSGKQIETFTILPNTRTYAGKTYFNPRGKKRYLFVYESLENATRTTITDGYNCGICSGGYRLFQLDPYVRTQGVKVKLDINGDVATKDYIGFTYGMILDYSISCNRAAWLCSIGNELALPLAYMTAAQIMEYSIFNATRIRVNNTVSYNVESNQDRYQSYMGAYNQQMMNVLKNMRLPNDPACFYCERTSIFQQFSL